MLGPTTSAWSAARKYTTAEVAAWIAGREDEVPATNKPSRGGSAEKENTEVAVTPTGPCGPRSVTTATPAGWLRNTVLKWSAVISVVAR